MIGHKTHYDWMATVPPLRNSDAGALTKSFGKITDEDAFKVRGTEARQRSTPRPIEDTKRRYFEHYVSPRWGASNSRSSTPLNASTKSLRSHEIRVQWTLTWLRPTRKPTTYSMEPDGYYTGTPQFHLAHGVSYFLAHFA